jgi:lipid II isoglutaminyl synthase (glutamine-hydrolysing)
VSAASPPVSRSSVRLRAATDLGRLAGGLSRSLHRGDGFVIGGRVVLAVCPDAFKRLVAGRRVAFVSATNGKTTTTRLLAAAMAAAGPVVTNTSGANMPAGLVAALASPAARVSASAPAVLEADETYLPGLLPAASRPLLVLGNLSRDQLDRVGEVAMVARRWRAIFAATPGVTAVANADDPHVAWAASVIPSVTWVSVGNTWTADSVLCPSCGSILRRADRDWSCGCGFRRPASSWRLADGTLADPGGMRHKLMLRLPGAANQANAAMAVVAAAALGVAPDVSVPALETVSSVGGRYQTVKLGGRRVRLLLGKNPAGWAEMFDMLAPAPAPIVIAINARAADGKDPSWLWDVAFEKLADRFVVATGDRRHDLAVRLTYAGVPHLSAEDPWGSLPAEVGDAGTGGQPPLDAVGTYTAFRELLRRGGGADDAG